MTTAIVIQHLESAADAIAGKIALREGWKVVRAESPAAALAKLGAGKASVVIAEADLLRGDPGWLADLRREHPRVPVVAVASQTRHEATVEALHLGAATFVPRDRLSRDLMTTVERIVALCCPDDEDAIGDVLAETRHRYVFGPDRKTVSRVLRHVQHELERFDVCDAADRLRVAVALEEALANAIVHGNLEVESGLRERPDDSFERRIAERKAESPYRDRVAGLVAAYRRGEATFVVTDEGRGFDPDRVPDPLDPENLVKPHGRGLLLMRTFMDEVRHNTKGNEVTLVKRAAAGG